MSKIQCPKCQVAMKIVKHNEVETDECPSCGGIWIDLGEEKQVLDMKPEIFTVDELKQLKRIYKPEFRVEEIKYFKCPHCQKFMWRKHYMSHSGIIVDKCRDHGTFFDKGELEKAIEFIKKGGVEYEKLKIATSGLAELDGRVTREVARVETTMYKLHWMGRFLSSIGF